MNEARKDNVHKAAQGLGDAIEKMLDKNPRVGVFYVYLDDDDLWTYGMDIWSGGEFKQIRENRRTYLLKRISIR